MKTNKTIWIATTAHEANYVAGALMALLLLDRDRGPIFDHDVERQVLANVVDRIDRQLVKFRER